MYARVRIKFMALMKKPSQWRVRVVLMLTGALISDARAVNRGQPSTFLQCFHCPFRVIPPKVHASHGVFEVRGKRVLRTDSRVRHNLNAATPSRAPYSTPCRRHGRLPCHTTFLVFSSTYPTRRFLVSFV